VYLSKDWTTFDEKTQRDTLVHELLHAHLAPLTEIVGDLFDSLAKNGSSAKVAKASANYAEERVVDQIAVAWARTLPTLGEMQ
jgi:hypothetical protein